jgi:hypothetical protein
MHPEKTGKELTWYGYVVKAAINLESAAKHRYSVFPNLKTQIIF